MPLRGEDNGGRLVHKDKSKTFSKGYSKFSSKPDDNKVSFIKKPRAFIIREEYSDDDGGDNDDKSSNKEDEGVAAIAISTPSNSLFDSPNENLITNNSRCLMAKVSSEVSSYSKATSSSNASTIDYATSLDIKREVLGLDAFVRIPRHMLRLSWLNLVRLKIFLRRRRGLEGGGRCNFHSHSSS
jgi:hypothetical protein